MTIANGSMFNGAIHAQTFKDHHRWTVRLLRSSEETLVNERVL